MNVIAFNGSPSGAVGVPRVVSTPVPVSFGNAPVVEPRPEPKNDVVEIRAPQNAAALLALGAFDSSDVRSGSRIHVDPATERIVVEILNANNEVIRQVPPEEVLRVAARFRQFVGLIFDQQA